MSSVRTKEEEELIAKQRRDLEDWDPNPKFVESELQKWIRDELPRMMRRQAADSAAIAEYNAACAAFFAKLPSFNPSIDVKDYRDKGVDVYRSGDIGKANDDLFTALEARYVAHGINEKKEIFILK